MTRADELAAIRADLATWRPRPKSTHRTGTTPTLQAQRERINQLTKGTNRD